MGTEIPAQLQKVEIEKKIRALDDQRIRDFGNSLGKGDINKD